VPLIKMLNKSILHAVVVTLLVMLTGCVTTERGGLAKADDEKTLEYSLQLAMTYIRSGNWDAAKRHLRTALDLDGSSAEVNEAMALVFQNTGEIELAEKHYKKSIKLDSTFSRARNNYAAFLYQQGRYKEAAKHLEIVVADTLYNKRSSAYVNMGRAYIQLSQVEKAKEAFHRAFLMDRNNIPLRFQLADVYFQLEDYPKSQQYYDAYRSQVKQQPAQALWLGIRLAKIFDNDNALSSFSLALKNLYPNSKEYLEYKKVFDHE
jgi:type IV pilus assembly protein PilF